MNLKIRLRVEAWPGSWRPYLKVSPRPRRGGGLHHLRLNAWPSKKIIKNHSKHEISKRIGGQTLMEGLAKKIGGVGKNDRRGGQQ